MMKFYLMAGALALALAGALGGCAGQATHLLNVALVVSDQTIIAAQDVYGLANAAAAKIVVLPSTSAAIKAAIGAANDKAANELHVAKQTRSSADMLAAASLIADFADLVGVPHASVATLAGVPASNQGVK